jgi:hypothetical protein
LDRRAVEAGSDPSEDANMAKTEKMNGSKTSKTT